MSLQTKPKTRIMTGSAGISETLKRQGYMKTLCFSIEPVTDERALDAIRQGICDIHITAEQLQDLRERLQLKQMETSDETK